MGSITLPSAGQKSETPSVLFQRGHGEREALTDELHARPSADLHAPLRLSHIALLSGAEQLDEERAHVTRLCDRFSATPPRQDSRHAVVRLGHLQLRWERHTEFSSYDFAIEAPFETPFAENALDFIPRDWLEHLPGTLISACHVAVEAKEVAPRTSQALVRLFEGQKLVGASVMGQSAEVYTAFRLHGDGFARYYVRNSGLSEGALGRLVRRLLEIETYRVMALLALPMARHDAQALSDLEQRHAAITARLDKALKEIDDKALLSELIGLAADLERRITDAAFRYGATRAYGNLVAARLEELREDRLPDMQPLAQFLERRFNPALSTCASVEARMQDLSRRIGRTSDLLRTKVDFVMREQNTDLLASMNQRATLQLRLQETVEGLSVVAISYYALGLLSYVVKSLPLPEGLTLALAAPIVLVAAAVLMRRVRARLLNDTAEKQPQ